MAECDRLQPGEPVAAVGAAAEDRQVAAHQLAAVAGETRPLLLVAAGGEPSDTATLRGHGRADRVAALARGVESATSRRKPGEASRGDGEVSEKSFGKQIKVPVGSIPKAHTWLPDRALPPGAQIVVAKKPGSVYCCGSGCQNGNPG